MILSKPSVRKSKRNLSQTENGYALIALIGIIMFTLILTTMAAPMVRKESQREKEEEMIWRGLQIARAIQAYGPLGGNGKPLTKLSELVEGREQPGAGIGNKIARVRFLRPSALCDPMMPCKSGESNWRLVHPSDQLIKEFYDAILAMQSKLPVTSPERQQLQIALNSLLPYTVGVAGGNLPGQVSSGQLGGSFNTPPDNGSGAGQTNNSDSEGIGPKTRPILGVVSEKTGKMFRNYYGIEDYDHSLFFQGVPVRAGGVVFPAAFGQAVSQIPLAPPRDQNGCIDIGGVKSGCLKGGICSPPKRVNPQTGVCE